MRKILISMVVVILWVTSAFAAPAVTVNEVYAKKGMVSSAHGLASKAGVEVMKKGGNAVDAAVATALALGVVEGNASSIGGSGFAIIRFAKTGEIIVLDYQSSAHAAATPAMFEPAPGEKAKTLLGHRSVAVPGWLMGMTELLDRYGNLTFAEVAAPAIRLAEEGFIVDASQESIYLENYEKVAKYNKDLSAIPFYIDEMPMKAGSKLKQPALAKTYRLIAKKGREVFYGGEIGEAIVKAVNANGPIFTVQDLKDYKLFERKPVQSSYRGYKVYAVPPASSGGMPTVQLLNILENFPIGEWGPNHPKTLHYVAEAIKFILLDRERFIGDPAFVKIPIEGISSKEYAKLLASKIQPYGVISTIPAEDPWLFQEKASSTKAALLSNEHVSTSTLSVVDKEGNIVTSTNSLSFFFGSGVFVPEYGFFLNNTMDNFAKNAKSVNAPEPGKRTLSTMSPMLIMDPQGRPFMSLGSAGGVRIMSAIAQITMNVIDHGMEMDEAIEQARIHNPTSGQKAGVLEIEPRMPKEVIEYLRLRGHGIEEGVYIGTAQGILFDHEKGMMNGGADSRRLGVAVGF